MCGENITSTVFVTLSDSGIHGGLATYPSSSVNGDFPRNMQRTAKSTAIDLSDG